MPLWTRIFALATCCSISVAASADIKPDKLKLAVNDAPVCQSFLSVIQQQYESKQSLAVWQSVKSLKKDIQAIPAMQTPRPIIKFTQPYAHPSWQWLDWTPWLAREATFDTNWGYPEQYTLLTSPHAPAEISERLMLRIYTIGWRGPFVEYALLPAEQLTNLKNPELVSDKLEAFIQPFAMRELNNSARGAAFNLFKFEDELYYLGEEQSLWRAWPAPKQVCIIAKTALPEIAEIRALHREVMDNYVTSGENENHGTLGFRPPIGNGAWYDLLARPWLLKPSQPDCADNSCIASDAVAKWLQLFGRTDAWSQREARALQELMALAELPAANFYQQHFAMSEELAKVTATQAIHNYMYQASGASPADNSSATISCGDDADDNEITGICAWQADYPLDRFITLDSQQQQQLLTQSNWHGKTALMWAAHFNDYDAIEQLLTQQAPVNAVTGVKNKWRSLQQDKRSALMYAAENAAPATIALLLKAGASTTAKDSAGNDLAFYLKKNRSLQLRGITGNSVEQLRQQTVPELSFACDKVTRAHEQLLCSSKGLRIYDAELSSRYQALQKTAIASNLKDHQRQWLKKVWAECKLVEKAEELPCYKQQYRVRVRLLDMLLEQLKPLSAERNSEIAY